jgi:hypothetical protein
MVSLDNNAAERALRRPVVTRKNAHGSRNETAVIWTVTVTAAMAGLNVLTYFTRTSTHADKTAASPSPALTWNDSCPGTPPTKTCAHRPSRPRPAKPLPTRHRRHRENGHAARRNARSHGFRILTSNLPRPINGPLPAGPISLVCADEPFGGHPSYQAHQVSLCCISSGLPKRNAVSVS